MSKFCVSVARRAPLFAALLILPLALAGCGGGGPSLGFSSPADTKGKFKTAAESRMETRSARRPVSASATVLSFNGEPGHLTMMEASQDLGFIRQARAEAYMRRVLNRLATKWPYETPKVGVFVRASDAFAASSTSTDILVPIVVFEAVDSEDQLAAILAHEFSHILLRHHEQIDQRRSLTKGVATAGSMATTMAFASELHAGKNRSGQTELSIRNAKAAENKALYAAAAQLAIQTLVNDIVGPDWSRTQESEADLLAVDLLESAGYDGRAMIEVLRKLGVAEEKRKKEVEDFSQRYSSMFMSAATSLNTGAILASMQTVAVDMGSKALTSVGEKLRRDHPDPEARKKDVQTYLNREYADALHEELKSAHAAEWRHIKPVRDLYRPVFDADDDLANDRLDAAKAKIDTALGGPIRNTAAARLVAYKVYSKRGDNEAAYRHLMAIRNWSEAPITAYAALSLHHAMRQRVGEGEALLDTAEKRFQSADVVLPSRIAMYRAAGRTADAQNQMALCQKSSDSDIRKNCEDASKSGTNEVMVAKKEDTGVASFFNPSNIPGVGALTGRLGQ